MALAQAEAGAEPPVPPPAALRPSLGFAKLPPRALADARRALDEDDAFRQRVRAAVVADAGPADGPGPDPEEAGRAAVGEAGWLLLDRPEGWAERLAALVAAEAEADADADAERTERRATKRLDRTLVELAKAEQAAEDAAAALAEERERRRDADRERRAVAEERDRLEAERAEAVRQLKALEQRDAERVAVVHDLQARVAELEGALAASPTAEPPSIEQGAGATPPSDGATEDRPVGRADEGGAAPTGSDEPGGDELPREAVAEEVARAARAARDLAEALAGVAELLGTSAGAGGAEGSPPAPARGDGGSGRGDGGPARRRPRDLPGGVFDDSVEAALFLCRLPAAVLLVDGYNVSMSGWGELELPAQRRRLVDALRNLQARTGVEPVVVFDGAEPESGPTGSLPRSVQVRFSPPGVIADDVVVELVDRYPPDRPVLVASSDAEVRQRARARGANVLAADQLLALLAS